MSYDVVWMSVRRVSTTITLHHHQLQQLRPVSVPRRAIRQSLQCAVYSRLDARSTTLLGHLAAHSAAETASLTSRPALRARACVSEVVMERCHQWRHCDVWHLPVTSSVTATRGRTYTWTHGRTKRHTDGGVGQSCGCCVSLQWRQRSPYNTLQVRSVNTLLLLI